VTAEPAFSLAGKRVWVAGHKGMVGRALVRRLEREDCELVGLDSPRIDLRRQADTEALVAQLKPDAVFLAAARVGGIAANDRLPGEFLYDNLAMEANIIEAARQAGVAKLLFLGSSCIYPKLAPQPITEEALLTGPLEPTNEWYAIAKIAGLKLAQAYRRQYGCDFISAMPTNLYGPYDNFDLESSHVLPALLRKAHEAKGNLTIWGSGTPLREFLHVDDCADALVHLMKTYSGDAHVNVGSGEEISIRGLAELIAETVGFTGALVFDSSRPDGTPRKLMSNARLAGLGWTPRIGLRDGVAATYRWFLDNRESVPV
jgi:GDP-L-fucose synthase